MGSCDFAFINGEPRRVGGNQRSGLPRAAAQLPGGDAAARQGHSRIGGRNRYGRSTCRKTLRFQRRELVGPDLGIRPEPEQDEGADED